MPTRHHSGRSPRGYRAQPEPDQVELPTQPKFPVVYIYLLIGFLFLASIAVSALFLMGGKPHTATGKRGNTLREQPESVAAAPAPEASAPLSDSSATAPVASSAGTAQPFLLRPTTSDLSDATTADTSGNVALSADDIVRKESLAEMEFNAKNYGEAERTYREILPLSDHRQVITYRIFACLLLEERPDAARSFLAENDPGVDSAAAFYCRVLQQYTEGKADAAESALADTRQQFPGQGAPYEALLKTLGYLP